MKKHDEGRRAFLVGTAIGAGAAASVAWCRKRWQIRPAVAAARCVRRHMTDQA